MRILTALLFGMKDSSTRSIQSLFFCSFCLPLAHAESLAISQHSVKEKDTAMNFSLFIDLFYGYDTNQPTTRQRLPFLYNHTRHDQPSVNLALLQWDLHRETHRLELGGMFGSYAADNLSAEPRALQNIFEAYAGWKLDEEQELWLDVGILPSHIGFESAISSQNFTLTRSILAENSPYFMTGARVVWSPNQRWEIEGSLINGWQRIRPIEGNRIPSLGTRVTFTPTEKLKLNWSTFLGTDSPDEEHHMRYFHNFYAVTQIHTKWDAIIGFDIGFEQRDQGHTGYHTWWSSCAILRYTMNEKWSAAIRGEYYADPDQVIVELLEPAEVWGASLNIDRKLGENALARCEIRHFYQANAVFSRHETLSRDNTFFVTSLAITFD